jgi:hypothetical protein
VERVRTMPVAAAAMATGAATSNRVHRIDEQTLGVRRAERRLPKSTAHKRC